MTLGGAHCGIAPSPHGIAASALGRSVALAQDVVGAVTTGAHYKAACQVTV